MNINFEEYDFIVVGSGLAGVVLAERISSNLNKKVLILEKREHIAGNCYDFIDKHGQLIHKYGPHLFHTDNKEVWEYLSLFTEWSNYSHRVLAYIEDKNIPIPFNFNSIDSCFNKIDAQSIKIELLKYYNINSKIPILELMKTKNDKLNILAEFIYKNIFLNYTSKQWGLDPKEIDFSVTSRVPVFIGYNNNYFYDKYQAVPLNGYTKMMENMIKNDNITLKCGQDFLKYFKIKNNNILINNKIFEGKIIYTGKIEELINYKFGALPYRSLNMKFETHKKSKYQEVATVNYPNNEDYTRITEFKHIHPNKSSYTTILKEYPVEYKVNNNIPYYPIFTSKNYELYKRYKDYLSNYKNLILIGRLTEYKYYDMDDIVLRALNQFKESFMKDLQ